jgi:protein involved in polysaccharide export with SLBB domain
MWTVSGIPAARLHTPRRKVWAPASRYATLALAFTLLATPVLAQNQQTAAQPVRQGSSDAQTAARGAGPLPATDGYRLGSGDRVRITVFGHQDLTGEYAVDGGGQLSFPLIGQVKAGGMSGAELERELISKLSPEYLKNPSVSVEVLTYRPFYIVGEVRTPGSYPFVSGMTVLNAIALAGGYTYRARENSFYVTRPSQNGGKDKLTANADTQIFPGDIITVRERYF